MRNDDDFIKAWLLGAIFVLGLVWITASLLAHRF